MAEWRGDDIDPENLKGAGGPEHVEGEEGDDVSFEAENNEAPKGSDPEKRIAKLKEELAKAKAERQEYLDGWQRSKADYVNLLKRSSDDSKGAEVKGVVKALETILPAFDALERAKEHGEVPEGFQAIARQIEGAMKELGLEALGQAGEEFDPVMHEAYGQDAVDSTEQDGKVTAVLEKGYKIGERVIRPAKVKVGKAA